MATSTFDKLFVVNEPEDRRRILDIIHSDEPAMSIDVPPYTQEERNKATELICRVFESNNTKRNP